MMNDSTSSVCATDAVRCLYLARVAEREGHPKAARRWLQKGERWLKTIGLLKAPAGAVVNSQGREPLEQKRANKKQALEGRQECLTPQHDCRPFRGL